MNNSPVVFASLPRIFKLIQSPCFLHPNHCNSLVNLTLSSFLLVCIFSQTSVRMAFLRWRRGHPVFCLKSLRDFRCPGKICASPPRSDPSCFSNFIFLCSCYTRTLESLRGPVYSLSLSSNSYSLLVIFTCNISLLSSLL